MSWNKITPVVLFLMAFVSLANPCDSIGTEKKNGKIYVLHKVEQGQTLYALSRKYGVKPDEISSENPEVANGVKVGMVVRIPRGVSNTNTAVVQENKPNTNTAKESVKPVDEVTYHTVEKGQGLYSIAKMYGVTVDEIKEWNNLTDNALKVGSKLKVSDPSVKKETVQHVHKVKTVQENQYYASSDKLIDTLKVRVDRRQDGASTKVTEVGVAETSDLGLNINQYEALHRTAPKGSFLTVLNLANNEKVFVKVVGKLPEETNQKTILFISPKAQKRLYSSSKFTAVEISYVIE